MTETEEAAERFYESRNRYYAALKKIIVDTPFSEMPETDSPKKEYKMYLYIPIQEDSGTDESNPSTI
jgi:hypothetical protein